MDRHIHRLRTQTGAFGKDIILNGGQRRLDIHAFAQIGGQAVQGRSDPLAVDRIRGNGVEIGFNRGEILRQRLLVHQRLPDDRAEHRFKFLLGADHDDSPFLALARDTGGTFPTQNKRLDGHFIVIVLADLRDTDFLMEGRLGAFQFVQDLLIKFLPVPEPGVDNLHILGMREVNHAAGQVGNLYRSAHVEDENLTAVALGPCFQYQLAGFGSESSEGYLLRHNEHLGKHFPASI